MKTIVLSLGGSLINPGEIDVKFLKSFKKLIEDYVKKDFRFVIYCGGGIIARKYQKAYEKICGKDNETMDWIGISATGLNAFFMRCLLYDASDDYTIEDPTQKIEFKKPVILAHGWKPGWSTDYDAVLVAKQLGISELVNMTDTAYVYDKDPDKFDDAKSLDKISWKDFRKLVGSKWTAGLNMPFDPIAAKEAEKAGLKVIILGKDLENFMSYLEGEEFDGSVIQD